MRTVHELAIQGDAVGTEVKGNEKRMMTRVRLTILIMFSLCSALSLFWGFALERAAHGIIADFKVVYLGTRCLIEHHDPYSENQMMEVYLANGGTPPANAIAEERVRQVVTLQVYFPTAFAYIAPFAVLPWGLAHGLWAALTAITFTLAAFLVWTLAQDHAPGASFYLLCFILANSGILFSGGNPAGLAVALCVIATWCFLEEKHLKMGIVCLGLSLVLKPHDAGLVWLYFLLAGGAYRKRALQTLALTAGLAAPGIVWISVVSPHWISELLSNLASDSARGGICDPGPHSMSASGGGMMVNLQTVISLFRDNPHLYNPVTYFVCGSLLVIWVILTVRVPASRTKDYLALASIAALSMLPVYHRPYDAKLLFLAIPACSMLWPARRVYGGISCALASLAIVFTSDLPLALLSILTKGVHIPSGLSGMVMGAFLMRPAPLALLALAVFSLFRYAIAYRAGLENQRNRTRSLSPAVAQGE